MFHEDTTSSTLIPSSEASPYAPVQGWFSAIPPKTSFVLGFVLSVLAMGTLGFFVLLRLILRA